MRGIKHISLILIITGLLLIAIPLSRYALGVYYQSQEQAAMLGEAPLATPDPTPPVRQEEPTVDPSLLPSVNGILEIPKIDLNVVVIHGVSQNDLKRGAGFYPQSLHPEYGNVSIAGHRTGYAGWFLRINKLDPGDEILLTMGDTQYHYIVREQFITHNSDWDVIASTGKKELTLTTCLITTNKKRLIVKADLNATSKVQRPKAREKD